MDNEEDGDSAAAVLRRLQRILDVEVEVELPPAGKRPSLWLPSSSTHALAQEQAKGIDVARHHEILEACGHFRR